MDLDLDAMIGLAERCAPTVAVSTLLSVVHAESGFKPLAIGVNGPTPRSLYPANVEAAAETATRLIAAGRSIDLGLGQINSANLSWLGLTVADAFDPCKNLAAAARVLATGYRPSDVTPTGRQAALRVAFSRYNTGDAARGFRNGYVARVEQSAAEIVPRLTPPGETAAAGPRLADPVAVAAALEPPDWDVFSRAPTSDVFVFPTSRSSAVQ
jgi:type IV secretion system protein VirB1